MTLGDEQGWEAEVLRLRFLNDLEYDHDRLNDHSGSSNLKIQRSMHVQSSSVDNDPDIQCTGRLSLQQPVLVAFSEGYMGWFYCFLLSL